MATATLVFSMFYILFAICMICPPNEFVSAGLTVEGVLSEWLGNEDMDFVRFHIHRSDALMVVHSLLPLAYVVGLAYINSSTYSIILIDGGWMWQLVVLAAWTVPALVTCLVRSWRKDRWRQHPIARTLSLYAGQNNSWEMVASDINAEFRRIDKICIKTSSLVKVVATDNWIIKVSPYSLQLVHQSDVNMTLLSSDTHSVSPYGPGGAQFLNIEVKSSRPGASKPFKIRLNAFDFKDLQDKVGRPIINLRNITIRRTLSDRFLEAFQEQVEQNAVYVTAEELEPCIGCAQNTSNIKLQKLCGSTGGEDSCRVCYCRPMWCLYCMGKWFASRQDQNSPETWLGSQCLCPTCRSRFCMLDVCLVQGHPSL